MQRAGDPVLPEGDEDQHVGRHGHRQHERPVQPAPAGEVVEGHQHRQPTADDERARPHPDAEEQAVDERAREQGSGDVGEGVDPAEEAGRQRDQRPDHHERHHGAHERPRGNAPTPGRRRDGGGGGGQRQPTSSISSTASSISGPASLTAIGSIFTSAHSAMCGGGRDRRVGGELAAGRDQGLGLLRREVLDQRDGLVGPVGAGDHPDAGDVGVGAGAVLVWPRRGHREVGVVEQRPPQVVVVGEAEIAITRGDRGEQLPVGGDDVGVVGHPRLEQRPGLVVAPLGDHVGDERLVVLVRRGPQAGAAPELRDRRATRRT